MRYTITPKYIERIAKQARRILAGYVAGKPGARIFPGYYSFEQTDRPGWWSASLASPAWGQVLGAHQVQNSPRHAFLVTARGFAVFNDPATPVWVPYEAIVDMDKLDKDATDGLLTLWWGAPPERVDLHFECKAAAFAFVQYLAYARQRLKIEGIASDPERP